MLEMKRHSVIVALCAELSDFEIANFLNFFVHNVQMKLKASGRKVLSASNWKPKCLGIIRTPQTIQQVQNIIYDDPRKKKKSIITKELQVSEWTVRTVMHEDI